MEKNFYIDIISLKIMFNLTKINLKLHKAKFMLKNSSILITGGTGFLVIVVSLTLKK